VARMEEGEALQRGQVQVNDQRARAEVRAEWIWPRGMSGGRGC